MNNTFNVRVSFKGDGELAFTLPTVGQLSIWAGKDIFLEGVSAEVVECLRRYRVLLLEHTLNADSKGCYKIVKAEEAAVNTQRVLRPVAAPKNEHIADLKKQMMKAEELQAFDEEILKGEAENEKTEDDISEDNNANTAVSELETDVSNDSADTNEDLAAETELKEPAKPEDDIMIYVITSGNSKGKKISELSNNALNKIARYSKGKDKEMAKKALDLKASN